MCQRGNSHPDPHLSMGVLYVCVCVCVCVRVRGVERERESVCHRCVCVYVFMCASVYVWTYRCSLSLTRLVWWDLGLFWQNLGLFWSKCSTLCMDGCLYVSLWRVFHVAHTTLRIHMCMCEWARNLIKADFEKNSNRIMSERGSMHGFIAVNITSVCVCVSKYTWGGFG